MQPISPAALIHLVGTALFGSGYQHDLATALGVNRRTVARWVSGEVQRRAGVWGDLLELIKARSVELGELVKIVAPRVGPGSGDAETTNGAQGPTPTQTRSAAQEHFRRALAFWSSQDRGSQARGRPD